MHVTKKKMLGVEQVGERDGYNPTEVYKCLVEPDLSVFNDETSVNDAKDSAGLRIDGNKDGRGANIRFGKKYPPFFCCIDYPSPKEGCSNTCLPPPFYRNL